MSDPKAHPVLDEIDIRLVGALQDDCKQPLHKLGERVGMSAPSVMERVRKLEQAGVIRGYHALLDGRKVGLDVTAFINVSINYPKNIASFERWVDSEPQVLECHHVTGEHTLLMKVKCRNTEALEQLISQLRSLDSVDRTDTTIVLSTRTERVAVPLEPAGEVAAERRAKERKPARRGRGKAS